MAAAGSSVASEYLDPAPIDGDKGHYGEECGESSSDDDAAPPDPALAARSPAVRLLTENPALFMAPPRGPPSRRAPQDLTAAELEEVRSASASDAEPWHRKLSLPPKPDDDQYIAFQRPTRTPPSGGRPKKPIRAYLFGQNVKTALPRCGGAHPFGFELGRGEKGLIAIYVNPESFAYSEGLRAGHSLLRINGVPCKDMDAEQAQRRMAKEANLLGLQFRSPPGRKRSSAAPSSLESIDSLSPRSSQGGTEQQTVPAATPFGVMVNTPSSPNLSRRDSPLMAQVAPPAPDIHLARPLTMWYSHVVGRVAKLRLQGEPDGAFLVRPSTTTPGGFTLSVKKEVVNHVRIEMLNGNPKQYFVDSHHLFYRIGDMVEFYRQEPLSNLPTSELAGSILLYPCGEQDFVEPRLGGASTEPPRTTLTRGAAGGNKDRARRHTAPMAPDATQQRRKPRSAQRRRSRHAQPSGSRSSADLYSPATTVSSTSSNSGRHRRSSVPPQPPQPPPRPRLVPVLPPTAQQPSPDYTGQPGGHPGDSSASGASSDSSDDAVTAESDSGGEEFFDACDTPSAAIPGVLLPAPSSTQL